MKARVWVSTHGSSGVTRCQLGMEVQTEYLQSLQVLIAGHNKQQCSTSATEKEFWETIMNNSTKRWNEFHKQHEDYLLCNDTSTKEIPICSKYALYLGYIIFVILRNWLQNFSSSLGEIIKCTLVFHD